MSTNTLLIYIFNDLLALPFSRAAMLKTILKDGVTLWRIKTRCFGGFYSSLQIKLASKLLKSLERGDHCSGKF
jgi:hypothetical protein